MSIHEPRFIRLLSVYEKKLYRKIEFDWPFFADSMETLVIFIMDKKPRAQLTESIGLALKETFKQRDFLLTDWEKLAVYFHTFAESFSKNNRNFSTGELLSLLVKFSPKLTCSFITETAEKICDEEAAHV